jgi:hypothetical protein
MAAQSLGQQIHVVNAGSDGDFDGAQHAYGELFKMMTGVDMLHVDTLATSIEHIRATSCRASQRLRTRTIRRASAKCGACGALLKSS